MLVFIGSLSFVLYILYDLNQVKFKKAYLHSLFIIASCLLLISTIIIAFTSFNEFEIVFVVRIVFILLALLNGALLIYTLFFALDFKDTYLEDKFKVCDTGMYALTRHPGLIWFIFTYLFLALALGSSVMLVATGVYSLLNFIYIVIQDVYVFPILFCDYDEYKKSTPFIIFNRDSVIRCIKTLKGN